MAWWPGALLGSYEVFDLIGARGAGEVHKARDTRLGRTIAIKILPADPATDYEQRQRLERDAKTISQIDHPHSCAGGVIVVKT